ncbi:MAG: hypothetical protein L3J56_01720 [Bacteroidales bacterium]|nr:hypothetical protein [Bacteroidales bacterium]
MKLKIFIFILIIFAINTSYAQTYSWSNGSADVLEQGRKEIGVFAPFKIGLKNSSELSVHPLLFFVIPNVTYKKQWKVTDNYRFASIHTLTYPTLLLKMLSRNGAGGILPATSTISQLFKLNNSALISIDKFGQTFTLSAGIDLCLSAGNSDFTYIEWPIVYPRTYSLNNTFTPHAGIDVTGNIYKKFVYEYKLNTFFLTQVDAGIITENQLNISWQKSDKFAVKLGAIYSYGEFPFGKEGRLYPMFDLMFGF